ncbi:hypothetical protein PGTUg99_035397 [Puccinia graminis f. sp. tritici]|uniref:Uncharacterized protein n=1 Tax=Puccinia graminis f. sp. tritici TaxID=56615 RepID=A0A5B0R9G3_PUCGR|nr:hypothetical protein PGTUg99_035397 [Puccinia graminis f. sp. tritici]
MSRQRKQRPSIGSAPWSRGGAANGHEEQELRFTSIIWWILRQTKKMDKKSFIGGAQLAGALPAKGAMLWQSGRRP